MKTMNEEVFSKENVFGKGQAKMCIRDRTQSGVWDHYYHGAP